MNAVHAAHAASVMPMASAGSATEPAGALDWLLWGILPYAAVAIMLTALVWRARYDRFGWTTHSSQFQESRLLRIGSPLFHYGMVFVILGHLVGLVVPKSWTAAFGLTDHGYHLMAVVTGAIAGICAIAGLAILVYRRLTVPAVRRATLRSDHLMYTLLIAAMLAGLTATVLVQMVGVGGGDYDYRAGISLWFRSLFVFRPEVALMAAAPVAFQVHIVLGGCLLLLAPFTRLMHVVALPVQYLFRPYVVYRRRTAMPGRPGRQLTGRNR